jgi:hypothetical protein
MVEMTMSDKHSLNPLEVRLEETDIWEEIIKSWRFATSSELKTAINDEDIITVFKHGHICTNSTQSTNGNHSRDIFVEFCEDLWFVRLWENHRDIESFYDGC